MSSLKWSILASSQVIAAIIHWTWLAESGPGGGIVATLLADGRGFNVVVSHKLTSIAPSCANELSPKACEVVGVHNCLKGNSTYT